MSGEPQSKKKKIGLSKLRTKTGLGLVLGLVLGMSQKTGPYACFPSYIRIFIFSESQTEAKILYIFTRPALQFSNKKLPSIPLPCSVVSGHL